MRAGKRWTRSTSGCPRLTWYEPSNFLLSFLELELELSVCPLAGKSSTSTIILRGSIEYSALVLCAVSSYLLSAQQRMVCFFITKHSLLSRHSSCRLSCGTPQIHTIWSFCRLNSLR
ncbi:hypothetical protein PMIN03_013041 [Paraphaeosphaeria minitans]